MWEIVAIAIGLSMDAFAAAVCKGLSVKKLKFYHLLTAGLWFGIFQALMPSLGYMLGIGFQKYIEAFDHWVAFALLALIGVNMILESRKTESVESGSFSPAAMLPLAVSTSIDALAVGVTFPTADIHAAVAVPLIGGVAFFFSVLGVGIGNLFGTKQKGRAELFGGLLLIFMGVKILLEHLGVLHG